MSFFIYFCDESNKTTQYIDSTLTVGVATPLVLWVCVTRGSEHPNEQRMAVGSRCTTQTVTHTVSVFPTDQVAIVNIINIECFNEFN